MLNDKKTEITIWFYQVKTKCKITLLNVLIKSQGWKSYELSYAIKKSM